MKSFLNATRQNFSRGLAHHLAARLGEGEASVSKALRGMVPLVLCQLIIKTGEPDGRELFAQLLGQNWPPLDERPNITQVLAILGSGTGTGSALAAAEQALGRLFGSSRVEITEFVHAYAGLRLSSASVLLQLVTVVLAAELALYAQRQRLTVGQLRHELAETKNRVYAWLPDDLPQWPGFRKKQAVRAPHAAWAAELARPYWIFMLLATGMMALAWVLSGGITRNAAAAVARPAARLRVAGPDSLRLALRLVVDSAAGTMRQSATGGAVTW